MNEYLMAFQRISESVEPVLKDEHNSLEIKQAVTTVKQSVEPCLRELKHSATKLKSLIQVSFKDLYQAEDVWNSKQRIAEIPTLEIWEQIGELSARTSRLRRLGSQCKSEAIKKVKYSWYEIEKTLTCNCFHDAKNNFKSSLNIFEKDNFIKEFRSELQFPIKAVKQTLIESLELIIYKELEVHIPFIQKCISQLDKKEERELATKLNSITESIVTLVDEAWNPRLDKLSVNVKGLVDSVTNAADTLGKQGVLGISWDQFNKCSKEVATKLETIVIIIFDELIRLAEQAIEQGLTFYNDFLERQMRYRQETPEQREAEKAWIEQQLQELAQVQNGIEAILNHYAG
ncbi:MAG: hypothetical protein KME57_27450 [Scytonema hyalinum WJT4-NPBG1]|jgi:hypothetical protein|nr:hypothetical protein [Scytonema hyalinum WJT4-NPBG1]